MDVLNIYTEDLKTAQAIIHRDEMVTRRFFYEESYPLFKSIFDKYYTGCENCKEFMDEIYLITLTPNSKTGKCQMDNYRGESTLRSWLKSVCIYYCYKQFKLMKRMSTCIMPEQLSNKNGNDNNVADRLDKIFGTIEMDFRNMNLEDAETLLNMMPNVRYRKLIHMLYLEHKSPKETAEALGMTMDNYYNKRILAEKQYKQVCRKEARNA